MAPHVAAETAESSLHLVGNEIPAGGMHVGKRFCHEACRQSRQTFAGERRAKQQTGETHAARGERVDCAFDIIRSQVGPVGFRALETRQAGRAFLGLTLG